MKNEETAYSEKTQYEESQANVQPEKENVENTNIVENQQQNEVVDNIDMNYYLKNKKFYIYKHILVLLSFW